MAAKAANAHAGRMSLWFWTFAAGLLVLAAAPTAVLLGILLAPCIAVWVLDRSPERGLTRITLLFGIAGTIRPLVRLWTGNVDWAAAMVLASNPTVLAIAWSGQVLGVLLAEVGPSIMRVVLEQKFKRQVAHLEAARTVLEMEWGVPPRDEGIG